MTDVKTATLSSGFEMPLIGFGTWQITGRQGHEATRTALEIGYRHIDTATMYGNEAEVGKAIKDSGVAREDIFVTTKVPADRAGRARTALEASLRALGTDYVDLWLIHWPPRTAALTSMWAELQEARDQGLARSIGVSNYSVAQIDELDEKPTVNQIPWSPADHDPAMVAECRDRGVVLEGYSPFKRSNLRDAVLIEIAAAHSVTPAQVVLRWHLEHGIVVIPKSVHPERIASNFDVYSFALDKDEVAAIDGLAIGV